MDILFLTGIKHSGKSNVGRSAVELLKGTHEIDFIDSDDLVQMLLPSSIGTLREFYTLFGKAAFMDLEFQAIEKFTRNCSDRLHVLATGGGVCDNGPVVELMKSTGKIIYLAVDETVLFHRIMRGGLPPFLSAENPELSFHTLFVERNARYRQVADFMVSLSDCRSIQENAEILAKTLAELIGSEEQCREIRSEQH
ncbi:MAG TPA: hypothetical protein DHV69_08660 [Sphaerochaeta sp.]|jgi:shikimate kinase|nr:MAG: hypothetical protein A2Y31_10960 [Spirochaetes bacterium GWC2_52_13]PKL21311.1 MAG: hypothetical protein CVV48_08480 [Spirochaetae bacterium HGW-Spirochaetae-4]HCG64281.1 hypothetical protein [Sphaerochaeta sp.]HCJ95238.1 hypothetical protein [Sphaerochaeta sp.]HCS37327.1 hypothetical protein [Sphaerochaeta sp.]